MSRRVGIASIFSLSVLALVATSAPTYDRTATSGPFHTELSTDHPVEEHRFQLSALPPLQFDSLGVSAQVSGEARHTESVSVQVARLVVEVESAAPDAGTEAPDAGGFIEDSGTPEPEGLVLGAAARPISFFARLESDTLVVRLRRNDASDGTVVVDWTLTVNEQRFEQIPDGGTIALTETTP